MRSQIRYDGRSYQLTELDIIWAARMVYGESGTNIVDGAAVLWTMTQRFALGRWPTFTALCQAYSQPINPRWARNGEFCRPGGRYHGQDNCSEARLRRRDSISNMPWDSIPLAVRTLVDTWSTGNLPNPVPRAIEFADPAVSRGFVSRNPGSVYVARLANYYIATATSKAWPANYVTMTGGNLGTILPAILLIASVFLLYLVFVA